MYSSTEPKTDTHRIVVTREDGVISIDLVGKNPDTRYMPRPRSVMRRIIERLRVGLRGPESVRMFGR